MEKKFEFNTFDRVLVRNNKGVWKAKHFEYFDENMEKPYVTTESDAYSECIPYNEETKNLQRTSYDYVPPYEPKDGDFVIVEGVDEHKYIAIFKEYSNGIISYYMAYNYNTHNFINNKELGHFSEWAKVLRQATEAERAKVLRKANEKEKHDFLELIHKEGKDWDATMKSVVKIK